MCSQRKNLWNSRIMLPKIVHSDLCSKNTILFFILCFDEYSSRYYSIEFIYELEYIGINEILISVGKISDRDPV